ncbi:UNVERIFIED_CONTAM: hypothetical protein K2H54_043662 [Gekko kuhli]
MVHAPQLLVPAAPSKAPSLFPLIVPSESIPSNGLVTVGCLAKDVMPSVASFSWSDQNNVSIDAHYVKQFPSVFSPAGTFTSCSQVAISANDWRDFQPFYCKATNNAGTGVVRVTRQTSCLKPEMIIRAPRLEDFENSDPNATIVCMAANLHTARATVQWLKNGHTLDSGFTNTGPVAVGHSGYSIISELTVDKRDWTSDKTFSCEVRNENFTSMRNISKSLVCDTGPYGVVQVHVETIPPSFTDIYLNKSAKLTCRISNMPYDQDPEELSVTWTREHSPYHAPTVYVFAPPPEQLALQETATITCLLKGFYPNDFFVKWVRNDEPIGPSEYFISKPVQESKSPKLYFTYSTLNVKEQDWSYGATFTCVVGHEALPFQTTQKTIDKKTGKPTHVNVSLVLSETTNTCY